MSTKELINAEIAKIHETDLPALYQHIKQFSAKQEPPSESIMSRLRKIKISAPPDFSENIDLYLTGEKTIEDVH